MAKKRAKPQVKALTMPVWPDVGRALGLGRNSVYEAVKRGEIPTIKIGKRILVPVAALDRLLAAAEHPTRKQTAS